MLSQNSTALGMSVFRYMVLLPGREHIVQDWLCGIQPRLILEERQYVTHLRAGRLFERRPLNENIRAHLGYKYHCATTPASPTGPANVRAWQAFVTLARGK